VITPRVDLFAPPGNISVPCRAAGGGGRTFDFRSPPSPDYLRGCEKYSAAKMKLLRFARE